MKEAISLISDPFARKNKQEQIKQDKIKRDNENGSPEQVQERRDIASKKYQPIPPDPRYPWPKKFYES